jgi:hypothetical protein
LACRRKKTRTRSARSRRTRSLLRRRNRLAHHCSRTPPQRNRALPNPHPDPPPRPLSRNSNLRSSRRRIRLRHHRPRQRQSSMSGLRRASKLKLRKRPRGAFRTRLGRLCRRKCRLGFRPNSRLRKRSQRCRARVSSCRTSTASEYWYLSAYNPRTNNGAV